MSEGAQPDQDQGAVESQTLSSGAVDSTTVTAQLAAIRTFLRCPTPPAWLAQAPAHLDLLLIDHANCEKKAAGNALSLLYRYVDRPELLQRLSRLAREELRHFEQVQALMGTLGIPSKTLTASRYAGGLRALVSHAEPDRLVDTLVVSAVVEARSCERFAALVTVLPTAVAELYRGLLASEARHFRGYLQLARQYGAARVDAILPRVLAREAELITAPDTDFRFHGGPLESGDGCRHAEGRGMHSSENAAPGASRSTHAQ